MINQLMEDSHAFLVTIGVQSFRKMVRVVLTYCSEHGKLKQIFSIDERRLGEDVMGKTNKRISDVKTYSEVRRKLWPW